jgi:predicted component of type VI protein secretion system
LGYTHHDHADRNELNNRKYNLRPATTQENARNHNRQKNNTSGVIGVGWLVQQNKWRAYIYIDKKHIGLGTFDNKNDAIIARLKAEQKYFGEFAPQKRLYEQYGIIEDRSEEN